jgi:hypothetical protein
LKINISLEKVFIKIIAEPFYSAGSDLFLEDLNLSLKFFLGEILTGYCVVQ